MLGTVDFGTRYASHARDCPTIAVYGSSPKARNKLTPRYLRSKCLALRVQLGVAKFASRLPAAGRKDKSVFEFRWVTSEQGISLITNTNLELRCDTRVPKQIYLTVPSMHILHNVLYVYFS